MTLYYEPRGDRAKNLIDALDPQARAADSLDELADLVYADRSEQLIVLGSGVKLSDALAFTGQHRLHRPALGVVLLRDFVDVAVLGEAIRSGVREVVEAADPEAI